MTEITEAMRTTAGKLGLQMSFLKTEILLIQQQTSKSIPAVPLGNEGIKVVDYFKYLGAYSSANGSNVKDINHRIGKASGTFRELNTVWKAATSTLPSK